MTWGCNLSYCRGRGGALVALIVAVGTAAVTTAVADSRATSARQVSLAIRGETAPHVSVGDGFRVVLSSSATLHKGDRILIGALANRSSPSENVAACRRSPCRGTWVAGGPRVVVFQALLAHGTGATAVLARSRRVTVTWRGATVTPPPQPPAPPPAPSIPSGHYQGSTSQNEAFSFDVTSDSTSIVHLSTGQVNQSCTPSSSLYGGNLVDWSAVIGRDGTFSISRPGTGLVGSSPSTVQTDITGRFSGALAQGTLIVRTTFTIDTTGQYGGGAVTSYSCTSNPQTWQATKTNP